MLPDFPAHHNLSLDTSGWPLIINAGDTILATIPLPEGSDGTDLEGDQVVQTAKLMTAAPHLARSVRIFLANHTSQCAIGRHLERTARMALNLAGEELLAIAETKSWMRDKEDPDRVIDQDGYLIATLGPVYDPTDKTEVQWSEEVAETIIKAPELAEENRALRTALQNLLGWACVNGHSDDPVWVNAKAAVEVPNG